ncbi:MAG: cyanophycinase [Alphaproteobacteria bacterium]|nr:cyanophycinase [Alphaproteobacteria bacterium]
MTLIAIGGAEDKTGDMAVHRRVLAESRGAQSRVCVITSATSEPEAAKKRYEDVYRQLGVADCTVLHIDSRAMAGGDAVCAALEEADVVFFTGGDQLRLTQMLAGTRGFEMIAEKYAAGTLVIAGTSAGAAAASTLMICGGDPAKAMEKGEVQMTAGFGFVPGVVFDTHFSERDRLPRLFNAVASHPSTIGIGLDEDTGAVLHRDGTMEVVGSGTVTFVDGKNLRDCNLPDVERGEIFKAEGFRVDRLASGQRYDLKARRPS